MQGINDTTLYAEKIYSQYFTAVNKRFLLSLHYNGDNSYLFVNGKQELIFKAKDDQIVKEILCLGNISDNWMELFMILQLIVLRLVLVIYIIYIDI